MRISALVAVFCLITKVSAVSVIFPKFGTPQVFSDRIIFTEAGHIPKRLICIDRKTGGKLWEISTKALTGAFKTLDQRLLVVEGKSVSECDIFSGKLKRRFTVELESCSLIDAGNGVVLANGYLRESRFLTAFHTNGWKKAWRLEGVENFKLDGDQHLYVALSKRQRIEEGPRPYGYELVSNSVAAVSLEKGNIIWKFPTQESWPQIAFANEFIGIDDGGDLHCLRSSDGNLLATTNFSRRFSIGSKEGKFLVWGQEGGDLFSGHIIYELSVPDLQRRSLLKPDWEAARVDIFRNVIMGTTIGRIDTFDMNSGQKLWKGWQWNWDGVHNGEIYFSELEQADDWIRLGAIEVETGKERTLYREELPKADQERLRKVFDR